MEANRRRDTTPEMLLRSALHALGLRYRTDLRLDLGARRVRPDVVFTARRVAVFVDGCFWHSCPTHATRPVANAAFWREKLTRNVERDRANDRALIEAGWTVIRVWEHEDSVQAAQRIARVVRAAVPVRRARIRQP